MRRATPICALIAAIQAAACGDVRVLSRAPAAQLEYFPARDHAPGRGTLRCILRDTNGDLAQAGISGHFASAGWTVSGAIDTVTIALDGLAAGVHEVTCTVADSGGRTGSAGMRVTVAANRSPPGTLTVARRGTRWSLVQDAVTDPDGDPVSYTVRLTGPRRLSIGPRTTPIDTTLALPEGRYTALGITSDGVLTDTVARTFGRAPPRAPGSSDSTQLKDIAAAHRDTTVPEAVPVPEAPVQQDTLADTTAFKAGYDDVAVDGGATSVGADLVADDRATHPLFDSHALRSALGPYYHLKRKLDDAIGVAIGADYAVLNQFASYSAGDRQAASGVFRIFGVWSAVGSAGRSSGSLVFKVENRHLIGTGLTPRNLGFETGSSLSTAAFKDFGWGVTALYWKQVLSGKRLTVAVGRMDPGDYSDVYPLLTPWRSFLSDAYTNNPAVALPAQGFGIVLGKSVAKNWYVSGGLHDANGSPTASGFDTFFEVREYYTWLETGWNPGHDLMSGEGVHLNAWHQDARGDQGTPESWGVTLSASQELAGRWTPFFRAGYAEGGAAQVRFIVAGGAGLTVRGGADYLGIATSWSGPPDRTLRSQLTTEAFYRLQLTDQVTIAPDLQLTLFPSLTRQRDLVAVAGVLRLRLAL